jgi:hypothetical protein
VKRRLLIALGLLALLVAYLLLWPTGMDAVAWTPPVLDEERWRPTAFPSKVTRVETEALGPEDVDVDAAGNIFAGVEDGMLRISASGEQQVLAKSWGRPLGVHWDDQGRLLIADAYMGLLRWRPGGRLETLTTECDGKALVFTDDLETTRDGRVWFSDASQRWGQADWKADLLEGHNTGRVCVYDPRDQTTKLVLGGLYFANGIAIDPDEQFLLVNETYRYRVRRVWIAGEKAGQHEVILDNMPGFPDGVSTGTDGIFWVAVPNPRNKIVDGTAGSPWVREVIQRLPGFLQPKPAKTARVMGITGDGDVIFDFFDETGADIRFITSVQERGGRLYLGSLRDRAFGVMDRPAQPSSQ